MIKHDDDMLVECDFDANQDIRELIKTAKP